MMTDKTVFKERVGAWVKKLDATVPSIAVRPMKKKWASRSMAGRVTFDSALLGLSDELQDYVIVQELLPLYAPKRESLMRVHLGDYEELERQLHQARWLRRNVLN